METSTDSTPTSAAQSGAWVAFPDIDPTPRRLLSDRSAGGIFVLAATAPEVDSHVTLELSLGDRVRFSTVGRVVRDETRCDALGGQSGYAVELPYLSEPRRRTLLRLIDKLHLACQTDDGFIAGPDVALV